MNLVLACRLAAAAELITRAPTMAQLLSDFGGAEALATAGPRAWRKAGLPARVVEQLQRAPSSPIGAREIGAPVRALAWEEPDYPGPARHLAVPPPVLFVAGHAPLTPVGEAVAVVGARKASEAGKTLAFDLARGLSARGLAVVSGLALGIDAQAHRGALAGRGATCAVLASDVSRPSPASNCSLARQILDQGGQLVSERPFGADLRPWDFPRRNRLIAALSAGLVVVEAGRASGTLSTVDWALNLGLPVGAAPGPVQSPTSQGSNDLLRQGAHVITSIQDIVDMLGPPRRTAPTESVQDGRVQLTPKLGPEDVLESDLKRVLEGSPEVICGLSSWILGSGLPPDRAQNAIAVLLARGDLRRLPGGRLGRCI